MSDLVSCHVCRQCNHKGKPSVMRGSMYCYNHRVGKTMERIGFFTRMKDKFFERFFDKDEDGFPKIKPLKGFRKDWILRH